MKVQVYFNLHKRKLSVRHKGKVIEHTSQVLLENATFHVQPAGREKVLREKRKNVHAYVSGERVCVASFSPRADRIAYNPYKNKTFINERGGGESHQRDMVGIYTHYFNKQGLRSVQILGEHKDER
jgi:uncharacterized DUF497 family protein